MEEKQTPGPLLGMCACDADLFERVWERVGAQAQPSCPIAPGPAESVPALAEMSARTTPEMSARTPEMSAQTMEETAPARETMPARETAPARETKPAREIAPTEEPRMGEMIAMGSGEDTGDDFPHPDDQPCLGRASAPHRGQLQQYIWEELEGWQLYRHLARRVNGPNARALAALASEKHRRARRLAAAHFLIAGVRYWPTDRLEVPRITSWLGTLRERFSAEQRHQHRYRAASYDTTDRCLAELYGELADECAAHAAALREVLEGAL